jgi:DNA-directed RNA polymerase subunit D
MAAERKAAEGEEGCKMEIRILNSDKKNGKLSFMIKDSYPAFVNALRRVIMEEVPTMAIEHVEFTKNNSILYDEMIAHRLGLMPLATDLKGYNLPSECKCEGEGCARCQVKMTLKAKGPVMVYASELKSKDPKIKPIFPEMPVVKLLSGQNLELEATAVLGQGKTHVKWSPGHAHYKQKPEIEIKDNCESECVEVCPTHTLEMKGDKVAVSKDNLFDCHLCMACVDASKSHAITVNKSDDFVFYLESWGQLSCKEIVKKGVEILNNKFDTFNDKIKG